MGKVVIFAIFMLMYNIVPGQPQKDFAYYNSETYKLYTEENWDALIPMAREAIANGHDFYYMRMRLGIAYFQLEQYVQAKKHFEKSLEFDQGSTDAKSYLYYCYLHLGRRKEALKQFNIYDEKSKFISSIYFEPGIKLSDNKASVRNSAYFFLGLDHNLGKTVSLFHGYQRLGADFATTLSSGNGFGQGSGSSTEYIYTVTQNEYYAALSFLVAKGFYITPAYHIQGVSTEGYSGTNSVLSIQLVKWLGKVKLYGTYYNSQINDQKQLQLEGGLIFYPMGNANVYIQPQATYHTGGGVINMIGTGKAGLKLFPKTWIDASFTIGNMLNYSESNGYLLYNQLDVIKSKWGLGINQYLGKHLLYLGYVHESKEEFTTQIPFAHHDLVLGFNLIF